jgi:hypothetical protein
MENNQYNYIRLHLLHLLEFINHTFYGRTTKLIYDNSNIKLLDR